MESGYGVDVRLIRTNLETFLVVESNTQLSDICEVISELAKKPLINPKIFIVDLNKIITDQQFFSDLGFQDGAHIKINIFEQKNLPLELENPQEVNRINLIFKDQYDKCIKTNLIGKNDSLNYAIEVLLYLNGFKQVILIQYRFVVNLLSDQHLQIEADPSCSFNDIFETIQKCTNIPVVQLVFEIVDVNNLITYQLQQFDQLSQIKVKDVQINIHIQVDYDKIQEKNREEKNIQQINLIFEIKDGYDIHVYNIQIDQNKTLNDAIEILYNKLNILEQFRKVVQIRLKQPGTQDEINPNQLGVELNFLQLKNNDKIVGSLIYGEEHDQ